MDGEVCGSTRNPPPLFNVYFSNNVGFLSGHSGVCKTTVKCGTLAMILLLAVKTGVHRRYSTVRYTTWAVQKVSDLNFFRLNKSSTGSVLHCRCGGDIYAQAWIVSCLEKASITGSRSMIVYMLWVLSRLSIIAKWLNELSSVIALNFAKSLAILKLKPFERFNRLSGTMPWVSCE
jgi:hypothetical protein